MYSLCLLSVSVSAMWIPLILCLVQVELKQVGLSSLCLGTCPHLTSLAVATSQLHTMDLKWVLLAAHASLHTLVCLCICSLRLPEAHVGVAYSFGGLLFLRSYSKGVLVAARLHTADIQSDKLACLLLSTVAKWHH